MEARLENASPPIDVVIDELVELLLTATKLADDDGFVVPLPPVVDVVVV